MTFKKLTLFFISIGLFVVISCNSEKAGDSDKYTREISDTANVAAVMHGFDAKDTAVIGAYLEDRSTITINDIDPQDTTYSTRTKILYKSTSDGKILAIVYGFKKEGKGKAVLQKIGEKPIALQEKDRDGEATIYSDGKVSLQKAGLFVFLDGIQYEEIR